MAKLDVNLMVVFEAIYDEGTTTRAAERLHLSQSAVSHALARLRDLYQDPLFVRHGHKMLASPLTERVIHQVKNGLQALRQSVDNAHHFTPAQLQQEFRLGVRDAIESALLPALLPKLTHLAPQLTLSCHQHHPSLITGELLVDDKLDLSIEALQPVSEQIFHTCLFRESLSVVGRAKHDRLQRNISLESYLAEPQILVTLLASGGELVDHALARSGLRRNVVARCQSYYSAAQLLLQSNYLTVMPSGMAKMLSQTLALAFQPIPFDVPLLELHLYWHQRKDLDPANRWLRGHIVDALAQSPFITLQKDAKALALKAR
ncbi:LysR family transcriptional regulator [Simiduia litorea]